MHRTFDKDFGLIDQMPKSSCQVTEQQKGIHSCKIDEESEIFQERINVESSLNGFEKEIKP